jgi:SpoVK/Ycf46/Vps4 family AAA+-type ATPase
VARYLASRESVLILQGPPGTGKTRLVRAILAALSTHKGDSARVLYTADQRALDNDEIFVEFITGSHDAFVIEDADHLLMARANGNVDLHRFLAIADGVVRAQGRKIIFTTNLPNVGDIDDALVRPGRCFATVRTRALERDEAAALAARLGADLLLPTGLRYISLAAFYKLVDAERAAAPPASA